MGAAGHARRSCLAVPGSNPKMLDKAQGLPADQVFLDLEDAVAPLAKPGARKNIVAALSEGEWTGKARVVRLNDPTSPSTSQDVLVVGALHPDYPGDPYHYILMRILMAARTHDLQAVDGPYLQIRDVEGFREVAQRSAALGFDGKWVLHPDQIEVANEVYSPAQADYDRAELILDAYEYYTSEAGGKLGAVMLGDEMIDEASRKMALVIAAKGQAAGMVRTESFTPPDQL